jgi:hypothetical protein
MRNDERLCRREEMAHGTCYQCRLREEVTSRVVIEDGASPCK